MCTTRLTQPASGAPRRWAVMGEMKVSQEDVGTRAWAWRGVGAGMASRFMANRALSSGARTNGAVCAAPGGTAGKIKWPELGVTELRFRDRLDPADSD